MNVFRVIILSAVCLMAFSVFYYYVIFLPRLETAKSQRETQAMSQKEKEAKISTAVSEKPVTEPTLDEWAKKARDLEQAQAEFARQLEQDRAKERESWETPNDTSYVSIADAFVHKSPISSSEVVARIPRASRVYVIGVRGNWLKIESKAGNPSGFIERRYAIPETEANNRLCLARADETYRANWARTCLSQGKGAGCTLLAPVAANLEQRHRAARDECFKVYPPTGVQRK